MMASNGCTAGQILKYNGTAWACAADATGGGGGVTSITAGTGLTGGTIHHHRHPRRRHRLPAAPRLRHLPRRLQHRTIAADGTVTCETDDTGPANAFVQGGNAFGATAVLGTTDSQALVLNVGSRSKQCASRRRAFHRTS